MFEVFNSIWDAVRSVPYLVADLLVGAFNAIVVGIGAMFTVAYALLPGFPDTPDAPDSGILGLLNWVVPLGPLLSGFATLVTAWIAYLRGSRGTKMGEGVVISPGDRLDLVEGDALVPCRVLTGWHEGLAGILFVVRRLTDGQRCMVTGEGRLVEVPG